MGKTLFFLIKRDFGNLTVTGFRKGNKSNTFLKGKQLQTMKFDLIFFTQFLTTKKQPHVRKLSIALYTHNKVKTK